MLSAWNGSCSPSAHASLLTRVASLFLLISRMFSCHVFFITLYNSSKQLTAPSGTAQPSKSTTLQQQGAKDDVQSHKDGSSGSSPRSDGACFSDPWGAVYFFGVFNINTPTIDSPLPSERIPNGTSAPPARQPSWPGTSANWSVGLPSGGSVGKPPPGRDPKSRARSRDYLKQYVFLPPFELTSYTAHNLLQMSPGNLIPHLSASNEPTPESSAHLLGTREPNSAQPTLRGDLQWSASQGFTGIWARGHSCYWIGE
jgi:hypothetical protein